jgi:deoxyadenosine/deoxycytidine kinase
MGKLVVVVGNSGVGKTTLVRLLEKQLPLTVALEEHVERPFQEAFSCNLSRWALANQVDYLLLRAEQERSLRLVQGTGIQDGGLDQDFWVFTRLFYKKGYLSELEYRLCERFYKFLRNLQSPPDLIISLKAPVKVIEERYQCRGRDLEITRREDLILAQDLLDDWLERHALSHLLIVDAAQDDPSYKSVMADLAEQILRL